MSDERMSDEREITADDAALSAFIDGSLPAAEAEALRRRLEREPALAQRLEALSRVDALLGAVYGGVASEPLPQRVVDLLRVPEDRQQPSNVVPLQRRPASRFATVPAAIAAGVALAVGFGLSFVLVPETRSPGSLAFVAESGLIEPDSPLYRVLQLQPSGESQPLASGLSATPRLSFRAVDGGYCRQLELAGTRGTTEALACRRDQAWQLELVSFRAAARSADDELFRPASGDASPHIEDAIDALIDGPPLGRDAEGAAIAGGWRSADR